jgi:hypothetical protein
MAARLWRVRKRVRRALRTAHLLRMATQAALVTRHGLLALGGKMARTPASVTSAVEGRHLARVPPLIGVVAPAQPVATATDESPIVVMHHGHGRGECHNTRTSCESPVREKYLCSPVARDLVRDKDASRSIVPSRGGSALLVR